MDKKCKINNCDKLSKTKTGLCSKHDMIKRRENNIKNKKMREDILSLSVEDQIKIGNVFVCKIGEWVG
jgi:hypothetical protein